MPHRPPQHEIARQQRRMAALREKTGLTDAELGEKLGVDRTTVNRWVNGVSAMSRAQWLMIATCWKLPKDWEPKNAK